MRALAAVALASLLPLAAGQTSSRTFLYTGTDQSFIVPPGVTMLNVKLWGAGGGGGIADRGDADSSGGGGGFTTGVVTVQPGEVLTLVVGSAGETTGAQSAPNYGGGGRVAYDWGCDGGCEPPHWLALGEGHARHGGSGGGRAAIRRGPTELATAGGGGGGGEGTNDGYGGGGGGAEGRAGGVDGDSMPEFTGGSGGTQTAKGVGGTEEADQHTGNTCDAPLCGAGGGGYYGGGASSTNDKPGGGGSGYTGGLRDGALTSPGRDGRSFAGGRGAGQKDADYPGDGLGNGAGPGEKGGDAAIVLSWSSGTIETECTWTQAADTPDDVLTCVDGTECGAPGAPEWSCCNEHGGRAHCPTTSSDSTSGSVMCARPNDCAGGQDFCCSTLAACLANHDGARQCEDGRDARITDGQVLWLPFIRDMNDHSASALAMDVEGIDFAADVSLIPGRVPYGALQFDGEGECAGQTAYGDCIAANNDLIRVVDNDPALDLGAQGSFAAWIYATDAPPTGGCSCEPILTNGRSGAYCPTYQMDLDSTLHFRCGAMCDPTAFVTSTRTVNLREWTHVACIWAPDTGAQIFINGELDATAPGMLMPTDPPQQGPFIGQEPGYERRFDGKIGDLRLFNRAITPTEILTIFEESEGSTCSFMQGAVPQENMLECNDGFRCSTGGGAYDCCGGHGGRARCPVNSPVMCARPNDCAGGTDYCCDDEATCVAEHGGVRQCDFNPKDVPGLTLWLDASEQDLNPAAWPDRSGHFGQILSPDITPPVVATGGLYAHNTVRFDNNMLQDVHFRSADGGLTLFVVVKADCTGAYHNIIDRLGDSDGVNAGRSDVMLWIDPNCHFELATGAGVRSAVTADHWQVVVATFEASGTVSLYTSAAGERVLEGASTGSSASAGASTAQVYYDLFNRNDAQKFSGEVAELLIYDRAVTEEEMESVFGHLQAKWGLNLDAVPLNGDFTGAESGYCAEANPDARKDQPDATDLASCEEMCRQNPQCVAVVDYDATARADWVGKCYLSLGACTLTATTAGGQIYHHIADGARHGPIVESAVCGGTAWRSWDECRSGTPSGGIHLAGGGVNGATIASIEDCVAACVDNCPDTCQFVSFSAQNGDCSWYSECDLASPPLSIEHYQSTAVLTGRHSGGEEGGAECMPETLDLTQAAVSASSAGGSYPPSNAVDRDETTYWEMAPGERDPTVMNSAWFQIDLEYEACVGSVDWIFYTAGWGPTEVLLQSSLDAATWSDVEHISVNLDELTPQSSYDGLEFDNPDGEWVFGSTFSSRRARYLRLVYLGDIQDASVAAAGADGVPVDGISAYYHSIRELFVLSGCCDANELTFHRQFETPVCNFNDFDDRAMLVTDHCCPTVESCDDSGMPNRCDMACALEFVPFVGECHDMLASLVGDEMAAFESQSEECATEVDVPHLREEAVALMDRGCILEGFMPPAPPPPPPPGGGHRRLQGLAGLHSHLDSDECPWDLFQTRADAVNRACCYGPGGECTGGIPTQCDAECAVVFPSFLSDCRETAASVLGENMDAYEALEMQCDETDPAPLMSAIREAKCLGEVEDAAAGSCLEIMERGSSTGDDVYWLVQPDGQTYQAYCDMTTDGGGWTLAFSSTIVDGTNEELGNTSPSPNQATLTPATQQIGIHTVIPEVSAIRFACDADQDAVVDVDFFYSSEETANQIYQMFRHATSEATFTGRSSDSFADAPYFDVVSNLDDVSFSSQRTEDNDGDANDFHLGTGGLPAAQATNGDDECYGRGFIGVTNCWGAYDGHNNMCSRMNAPASQYAPSVNGFWYVWLR